MTIYKTTTLGIIDSKHIVSVSLTPWTDDHEIELGQYVLKGCSKNAYSLENPEWFFFCESSISVRGSKFFIIDGTESFNNDAICGQPISRAFIDSTKLSSLGLYNAQSHPTYAHNIPFSVAINAVSTDIFSHSWGIE